MEKTQIAVSLPRIVQFEDYHQFGYFAENLRSFIGNRRIHVTELGFDESTGMYEGVVTLGKPTRAQLKEIIATMASPNLEVNV